MLAKDTLKLTVVRGLTAAFMNEEIAKGKTSLSDEDALAVIKRSVKQRKDSIDQFKKGGRPELATDEEAEMKILETYLPKMMSKAEIKKVVEKKKAEMGTVDKAKLGQFMGAVMKELKGQADGGDVKEVVESIFK